MEFKHTNEYMTEVDLTATEFALVRQAVRVAHRQTSMLERRGMTAYPTARYLAALGARVGTAQAVGDAQRLVLDRDDTAAVKTSLEDAVDAATITAAVTETLHTGIGDQLTDQALAYQALAGEFSQAVRVPGA